MHVFGTALPCATLSLVVNRCVSIIITPLVAMYIHSIYFLVYMKLSIISKQTELHNYYYRWSSAYTLADIVRFVSHVI